MLLNCKLRPHLPECRHHHCIHLQSFTILCSAANMIVTASIVNKGTMQGSSIKLICIILMLTCANHVDAADKCEQESNECTAIGKWNVGMAIGIGARSNPLLEGKNIPLVLVPTISYYGRHFFLNNLDFGWTFHDSAASSISLVASPGYDRVFFYRYDLQNFFVINQVVNNGAISMTTGQALVSTDPNPTIQAGAQYIIRRYPDRSRDITYLAGPEWTFQFGKVTGQVDLFHEVTGKHGGNEIRAALKFPLISSSQSLSCSVGFTWKSAAVVNYYYGDETIYQGGSSLNPFIKVSYSRPMGNKWKLLAFVHYEQLGSSIANSPIVAMDHVNTGFVGALYAF